jgi:hypothetical protein
LVGASHFNTGNYLVFPAMNVSGDPALANRRLPATGSQPENSVLRIAKKSPGC